VISGRVMVGVDGDAIFTPSEESESRRSGVSIPSGLAERGVNWRGRIVMLLDVGLIDGGRYLSFCSASVLAAS
jgi:hypothetical protein